MELMCRQVPHDETQQLWRKEIHGMRTVIQCRGNGSCACVRCMRCRCGDHPYLRDILIQGRKIALPSMDINGDTHYGHWVVGNGWQWATGSVGLWRTGHLGLMGTDAPSHGTARRGFNTGS